MTRTPRLCLIFLAGTLLLASCRPALRTPPLTLPAGPSLREGRTPAQVVRVIDGDTVQLLLARGQTEKVRLIGVNTPETKHPRKGVEPFGKQASAYTKKRLSGQVVSLELDVQHRDRYGRLLGYIYLQDGTFFNAELIREGYARTMTIPPNVRYQEVFLGLEREAREKGKGLWAPLPID